MKRLAIAALLLLCIPLLHAQMFFSQNYSPGSPSTISYAGEQCDNNAPNAGSMACTISSVGAGHALIVAIVCNCTDAGTTDITSVTDSAGGTPTLIRSQLWNSGGQQAFLYSIPNTTAGVHTITATFVIPINYPYIHVVGFAGANLTAPIDTSASAENLTGVALNSGPLTTAGPGEMIYGFSLTSGSGSTVTSGAGFIPIGTGGNGELSEYAAKSLSGTYNATFAATNSGAWVALDLALKP